MTQAPRRGWDHRRTSQRLSLLFGAALVAAVAFVAVHFSEGREFARIVEESNPWWILAAVALQAATYFAQAEVFRGAPRVAGAPLPRRWLYQLSLVKLFLDQAVPSAGISSAVATTQALRQHGVARDAAAASAVINIASYHAAYVVTLLLALAIAALRNDTNAVIVGTSLVFVAFAVAFAAAVLAFAGRRTAGPHAMNRVPVLRNIVGFLEDANPALVRNPTLLIEAIGWQAAIFVFDAATMWVLLLATGVTAPPAPVFASFMISSVFRTVGVMPGGLGTYEAASILTLRMIGVSLPVALSATLVFRGLSFWLPMLPGMWFSHRLVTERRVTRGNRLPGDGVGPSESLEDLFEHLRTSPDGLSSREADQRLAEGGPNDLPAARWRSTGTELVRASANPLVVILLVAGIAAAFLGEVANAIIIGAIVFMSAGLNFWQTFRSERAVVGLQEQVAPTATVRRDGAWMELPRRQIVVGDILHLGAGDLVPADARLIDADDLYVQQAALTGESLPVEKAATPGVLPSTGPDSPSLVYLGTSIVSGTATAIVGATGAATAFGDIVARLASRPEETEFERGSRRFGMLILQTVFFLVLFILVVNLGLGRNALQSMLFSLALAVGLTPEFLPMITTVTLAQGAIRMAREKVIVKHLSAIQNLGSIDILCSDKTGTLTAGTMSLDQPVDPFGAPSDRALFLAVLNSRFETGVRSPLDAAILERTVPGTDGWTKTDEIPFDFERRRLTVVLEQRGTRLFITKGAPEGVVGACSTCEIDGTIRPLDAAAVMRCLDTFHAMSERGYRVLAVASRQVSASSGFTRADERDLTLAGFLTFADHPVESASNSIARLQHDGVRIKILTGDNELVTRHVCSQVGLDVGRIVLGDQIEHLDEQALASIATQADVFARVSPAQKHRIIHALKARGHVVGFLGDGINDAPSLHAADVGISVAGAVDVAREASDIVLLEPGLDVLHAGIIAGRTSFGNVLKYLLMGTSSNFGNMFSMAGAALFLPFLPMLPTQILLNNFLYDFAQITIPTDNIDPIYVRRPQRWDMRLIRNVMLLIGPVSSAFDFLTFAVLLWVFHFGEVAFHTGWFVESLATQTLVLFVIRTAGRPWTNRPSAPLAITAVLVVVAGLLLPYTPAAGVLGLTPMPPGYFLFLVAVVGTYLAIVEVVKERVMRRWFVNA